MIDQRSYMRKHMQTTPDTKNERGAALVMVLLITFILMTAAAALILEASVNTANVTDATAEQQAYYAAEGGLQSTINVLRHDIRPNPLIDPSKSPYPPDPDAHPANKLDYSKAVRLSTSNSTQPALTSAQCAVTPAPLDCTPRLSRWLNYGNNAAFPDRIVLGDAAAVAAYTATSGFAYKVSIIDPDNVGTSITYNTLGIWTAPANTAANSFSVSGNQLTITDLTNSNTVAISYQSSSPYVKDVHTGESATDYGKFVITPGVTNTAAGVTLASPVRVQINVSIVQPYGSVKVVRGYLDAGTITSSSVTTKMLLGSQDYVVYGSVMHLDVTGGTIVEEQPPAAPTGMDGVYRTGYEIPLVPPGSGGETVLSGTITAPEPVRVLIRSTGFGPNGATKELDSIVQKSYFDGLGAPSPLTLIGPPCTPVGSCTPTNWAASPPETRAPPKFVFDAGSSSGTYYSGKDKFLKEFLPPIGLTHDPNLELVRAVIRKVYTPSFGGSVFGNPSNIGIELPNWLQSPKKVENTLARLKLVAQSSGTYYGPGVDPPTSGGGRYGDFATATGITFIDGDLEFSQDGGGILIVTGGLVFKGGFKFNGLILVTGPAGISRTGGGKGSLQGNMIVAPYTRTGINSGLDCSVDVSVTNKLDCFLAPRYDISGGGSSEIVYNSNNVTNGLGALTNIVKGVAEK